MSLDYSNLQEILERVKGQLRWYQIRGVAQAIRDKHTLFDMYMGLGKTVTALTATFAHRPKKVLILCGQNALGTWIREVRGWFPEFGNPEEFVVIPGKNRAVRGKLWAKEATFYICTKETFILDQDLASRHSFDVYIIDEVHRIPKHTTKTFKALLDALENIPIRYMLTGTWIKKHAGTGWRQLHMLNPKAFPSYWAFINKYCVVVDGGFGKEITGPRNTEDFKVKISNYVYRFKETSGNIPKSVRKQLWIEMNPEQEKIYSDLSKSMFHELESGKLIISSVSVANFTKHRQVLCCPKILDPALGLGAAFNGVLDLLKENEDDPEEQHCVIFTPFRAAVSHFRAALEERGYPVFEFVGGVPGPEIERRAVAFRALQNKPSIAIGTVEYAESYHLGTSIRSHFIGPAWYADAMKQAEARLARADSDLSKTIVHRYWLYQDTMDERRVEVIQDRVDHVKALFRNVDDLMAMIAGRQK